MMPQIDDSNAVFGFTDFEGILPEPIPLRTVLGDSHGALFAQECLEKGMCKATYGTGSSVMINIGHEPIFCKNVVTSLAWGRDGIIDYVLEGNINYTGDIIKWLTEDLGLLSSSKEAGPLAAVANPADTTYLVPAFSGLGAPHWVSGARACLSGMTRGYRPGGDCQGRGGKHRLPDYRCGPRHPGRIRYFPSGTAGGRRSNPGFFFNAISGRHT
jgi:glycerol kinase